MIDYRKLTKLIGSSCLGMAVSLAAAVTAQDGLGDYEEDLSMYGTPRPTAIPASGRAQVSTRVADVDETLLDRRVVGEIVRDHRHRAVDQFGDYMEDFRSHAHDEEIDVSMQDPAPTRDIEVIITIRSDDIGEREITRYFTRRQGDDWHTITFSAGQISSGAAERRAQ